MRTWPYIILQLILGSSALYAAPQLREVIDVLNTTPQTINEMETELRELEAEKGASRFIRSAIKTKKQEIETARLAYADAKDACLELLKEAEKSGNINCTDSKGRTLLMLVAATGHDRATQLVLQQSPQLDITDEDGMTACDYEQQGNGHVLQQQLREQWQTVMTAGDYAGVQQLLNSGADANWPIGDNIPPLLHALEQKNDSLFSLLLTYGASADTRLPDGRKLTEMAVEQNRADMLEQLLARGGTPPDRMADGRDIIEHLSAEGADNCLLAWLRHLAEQERIAALCKLVRRAPVHAVRTAFNEFRAELGKEDADGNMPLHEAARRGRTDIYQTLIELGADASERNMRQETTLMHAALSGNPSMLSTVLPSVSEEELQAVDENGMNALDYALMAKDKDAAKTLQSAGLKKTRNN